MAEVSIGASFQSLPRDRWAYFIFMCLGIGSLLQWNAFVTAVDYYQHFYPQYHPDRVIPVLYKTLNVIVTGLLVKFGSSIELNTRILFGFTGYTVSMLGVPFVDKVLFPNDQMDQTGGLVAMLITLSFVAVIAVANGFVQGSLFGLCGPLPPQYTGAAVIGTAVSGVFVCLLRIGSKAVAGDTPAGLTFGIYVYFSAGGLFSLFCIYLHKRVMPHLPTIVWHKKQVEGERAAEYSPLLNSKSEVKISNLEEGLSSFSIQNKVGSPNDVQLFPVFKKIWWHATAVALGYMVTLSIFPGVLAEDLRSKTLKSWYPVLLITVFNVGDMLGKMSPFHVTDGPLLLLFSVMRLAFVPIYAVFVKMRLADVSFFSVTFALGITNGFATTCNMSHAPTLFTGKESEVAGTMMIFFLLAGLSFGAMAGWLWVFL